MKRQYKKPEIEVVYAETGNLLADSPQDPWATAKPKNIHFDEDFDEEYDNRNIFDEDGSFR